MSVKVSVVVVNYNGKDVIKACLDSLINSSLEEGDLEIIVVDNNSKDESLEILRTYKDKIILIENKKNIGFAQANNQAIDYMTGNYLFMLNNDTRLYQDTIQILYDAIKDKEDIGAIAPKLLNEDLSLQCPGSFLGAWHFRSKKTKQVPFICGAAVLIKKEIFEKIGKFDHNLFFYNDDIDLCKKLKENKLKILYVPESQLIHIGGVSTKTMPDEAIIEGYRGGLYICHYYYPKIVYALYRLFLMIYLLQKLACITILSLFIKRYKKKTKIYKKIIKINITNDIYVDQKT